jgi:hypothetical protein
MFVGGRVVRGARVWALPLLALSLLVTVISDAPGTVYASHLCDATGSPAGPFDFETYEAADYRKTYGSTMDLAAFNQLFPEHTSFALPPLETGDRAAGSASTTDPYIPPVLLKAIAWIESGWAQGSYDPLVQYGEVGPTLVSHDCGYGIMQVTTGMQNVTGIPNLDQTMIGGHYAFNIARGARILADKWNMAPEFRPLVGTRDPKIIENWYYALWGYNGFAFKNHPLNPAYDPGRPQYSCGPEDDGFGHDRSVYPYQELVLGCAAHPPSRNGEPLWDAVEVHLPDLNDPQFADRLKVENWDPCSSSLVCEPMDIPTPNANHTDPTVPAAPRAQVLGIPALQISHARIALPTWPPGGGIPVTVTNPGSGLLTWRATSTELWLKLSRSEGVSLGADLGGRTSTFTVSADGTGLGFGNYTAKVIVESMYATAAPQIIQLEVHIGCEGSGSIDATDALQILRHVSGLAACTADIADANCSGAVDAVDALVVLRHVAALPTGVPEGCPPLAVTPAPPQ